MLNLKTSAAAAILAGTAASSAGSGYVIARVTTQTAVAVNCPSPAPPPASAPAQSRLQPPLGNLPATTGGKQW